MITMVLWIGLAGLLSQQEKDKPAEGFVVPYRLSKTQHIVVRAKVNGSAPLNFVIDTGAPAFFIAEEAAKKAGITSDEKGWAVIDEVQFEGQLKAKKVKARIETPFQLKGMNGMGLAGIELHGMIGYSILAKYEIRLDLKKDHMIWTPLDWTPPEPKGLGGVGKKNSQGATLELLGSFMQGLGGLTGGKAALNPKVQGFSGLALEQKDGKVVVSSVFVGSPAAKAGLMAGDEIKRIKDEEVKSLADAKRKLSMIVALESVEISMVRGKEALTVTLKTAFGF